METVAAWCDGRLAGGAPSSQTFLPAGPMFKPVPLPGLAAVPIPSLRKFPAALLAKIVNARAFSKQPWDGPAQLSLRLIGEQFPSCQAYTC